jgi:hypothetical protein
MRYINSANGRGHYSQAIDPSPRLGKRTEWVGKVFHVASAASSPNTVNLLQSGGIRSPT